MYPPSTTRFAPVIMLAASVARKKAAAAISSGLQKLTRQISLLGIMAMGMTMVIAVGGVDLSVGAVYAICSTSAAAYIGGASPIGGGGTIVGTLIGALIMGVLQNGLVLLGVNTFVQQIVIGMLVIVAVMIDVYRNEKRKSG